MIRSAVSKVMWVGRATVFLVGLAVILALVFGVVSRATAHDGFAGLFHLGHNNPVSALSTLTKSGSGPALSLKVGSGAPLAVNSSAKVAKLNSDRLDGKDSTALGVTTKTSHQRTGQCDAPESDNECAKVTVRVPPGKQYRVSVISSFVAGTNSVDDQIIHYCPAIKGGSFTSLRCIAPTDEMFIGFGSGDAAQHSATITGEVGPLGSGTYTISTLIDPDGALIDDTGHNAHTTVLVRDASAGPPIN